MPNVQTYSRAISENEVGDIVYIYGQVGESYYEDDYQSFQFINVEKVDSDERGGEKYAYVANYLEYNTSGSYERISGWVVLKCEVVDDGFSKDLEVLEVINVGYGDFIGDTFIYITPYILLMLLSLPIALLGGLYLRSGYRQEKRKHMGREDRNELREKRFNLLIFFILCSLWFMVLIINPIIIFLIIFLIMLYLYIRFKTKISSFNVSKYDLKYRIYFRKLRPVKSGFFLIPLTLIIWIILWFADPPNSFHESFNTKFFTHSEFLIMFSLLTAAFVIFLGGQMGQTMLKPDLSFDKNDKEFVLWKIKYDRYIYYIILITILLIGVIAPLFIEILIPGQVANQSEDSFQIVLEENDIGDTVIVRVDEFDHYYIKDGDTYLTVPIYNADDYSSNDYEFSDEDQIIFKKDISDEIPKFGEYFAVKGTIKTNVETGELYIEGEEIYTPMNNFLPSVKILIFLNIFMVMGIILVDRRLKQFRRYVGGDFSSAQVTKVTKVMSDTVVEFKSDGEANTGQSEMMNKTMKYQCPSCGGIFEVGLDENMLNCPHCGVSGVIQN